MNKLKRAFIITMSLVLMATLVVALAPTSTQVHAQGKVESANLAKFAALLQYIRSEPTPSDVHPNHVLQISNFDSRVHRHLHNGVHNAVHRRDP